MPLPFAERSLHEVQAQRRLAVAQAASLENHAVRGGHTHDLRLERRRRDPLDDLFNLARVSAASRLDDRADQMIHGRDVQIGSPLSALRTPRVPAWLCPKVSGTSYAATS